MIADQNRIYDGWLSLEGGVDAGRNPAIIDPNQCESAENVTFRGGDLTTRPGFRIIDESFLTPNTAFDAQGVLRSNVTGESTANYRNGVMQGAIVYSPHGNEDCIVAMIGGRMYKIVPDKVTARVTEITVKDDGSPYQRGSPPKPAAYRNRKDLPIAYMCQADKWLVIQDGNSKAILFDGVDARRSKNVGTVDTTEVPTGTIMAYGMGRLVVIVNERDVAFGDLFGSHEGDDPGDSIILFTERNFLAEGFDAAVPIENGIATGMAFFPQLDTSTGNGQLLVFSERGATSFLMSLPREVWKTSEFQIFALLTTGMRGHRSLSVVNEDLWFRSQDGVRSYRQARSEATGWAHIPLSTNVKQFTNVDDLRQLKFCSSSYFDNRMLLTASPYWNHGRPLSTGLLVVDFDILSAFGDKFKPAWEGRWRLPQGINIAQIFTGQFKGVQRTFIFGVTTEGENQLYELSLSDTEDWDTQCIDAEMVSRMFDFTKLSQASNPFTESELYGGDIWIKEIRPCGRISESPPT